MNRTDEQQAVVDCREKALAVNATAGSGKTHTVTQRAEDVGAGGVLFLAFNREAAREINRRMGWDETGRPGPGRASTLDSAAWAVANAEGQVLLVSDRRGKTKEEKDRHEETAKRMLGDIGSTVGRDLSSEEWSRWRRRVLDVANRALALRVVPQEACARMKQDPRVGALADRLLSFVLEKCYTDFNLVSTGMEFAIRHLERGGELPDGWEAVEEIIVDEAQDLTPAQWRFVDVLVGRLNCRMCLVGDDLQAVYGWRGADVETFISRCEGSKLLTLTQNFRCGRRIVELGSKVGRRVGRRIEKSMAAARDEEGSIRSVEPEGPTAEALEALRWVREGQKRGVALREHLVLARTNAALVETARALFETGVPVDAKGWNFGGQKEVQRVMDAARSILGEDRESFLRAAVVLPGVGRWAAEAATGWEDLERCARGRGRASARSAWQMLSRADKEDLGSVMQAAAEALYPDGGEIDEETGENGRDTALVLARVARKMESLTDLERFLGSSADDGADRVRVSTIHRTKGAEATRVMILSCGLLPHPKAGPGEQDAELRLTFVAVTRAKDELWLSFPKKDAFGRELGEGVLGELLESAPPDPVTAAPTPIEPEVVVAESPPHPMDEVYHAWGNYFERARTEGRFP